MASVSFVAAAEPSAQAEVLADVEALLRDDPDTAGRDTIELPYDTDAACGRPAGRSSPASPGVVASVNLNRGGVPEAARRRHAWSGRLGLEGDGHANPDVHGGPTAAVCLYPQEAIERVRADGHQAFPGSYGENLTLLGIDWTALDEGDRLELGEPAGDGEPGPLLELTQYAAPCATAGALVHRGPHRAHQPQGPARGRPLVCARPARGAGRARDGRPGACREA